jgi:hypothetical protein
MSESTSPWTRQSIFQPSLDISLVSVLLLFLSLHHFDRIIEIAPGVKAAGKRPHTRNAPLP